MEPQENRKRQCPKNKAVFAFQVEDWNFSHLELHQYFINKKEKNTSTTSRATRQAVSLVEERSGVEADKQEPVSDPTILLYLFISFNLQSKSSQYSKLIKSGWASTFILSDAIKKERALWDYSAKPPWIK